MSKSESDKKLTDKQELFCKEYLVDLNATQAAIRAGYSEKTANEQGSQNLVKLSIQNRIQELFKGRSERTQITADRVLQEYARIGFSDIRKLYKEDGTLKMPNELDDDIAAALSGIDVTEEWGFDEDGNRTRTGETKKVKMYNKQGALDSLAKHLGLFEVDNKQKASELIVVLPSDGN